MSKTFYVRPERPDGYGAGDGSTYDNAWNGMGGVDWQTMSEGEPATLWVCGGGDQPSGFLTVFVEMSYLQNGGSTLESAAPHTHPRRESAQPV
jgi:hypothetical protein